MPCQAGYFLIADISKCRPLIPEKFFETHDYDSHLPASQQISKYRLNLPGSNKIPLDLAFCRWMGTVNKVTVMPLTFFYQPNSPHMNENFVRLAICKPLEKVKQVCAVLRTIKVPVTTTGSKSISNGNKNSQEKLSKPTKTIQK